LKRLTELGRIARLRVLGGGYLLLEVAGGLDPASPPEAEVPRFRPGQFAELGLEEFCLPRPFSILRQDGRNLHFLLKVAGSATRRLAGMDAGTQLRCTWPLGNHFPLDAAREILLVGGGTGVAPLIAALWNPPAPGGRTRAFFGFRSRAEALACQALCPPEAQPQLATEDGEAGFKGLVSELLEAELDRRPPDSSAELLCCGPEAMMRAVARICRRRGLSCRLSLETYMGCGIGICSGCAVRTVEGPALCCRQGPIFEAEQLEDFR